MSRWLFESGEKSSATAEPPVYVRLPSGGMVYGFQGTSTMPNDNPGKLSRDQYADIVAYLLQLTACPPELVHCGPIPANSNRSESRSGRTGETIFLVTKSLQNGSCRLGTRKLLFKTKWEKGSSTEYFLAKATPDVHSSLRSMSF
jgi:hypothetical protein